MAAELIYPVAEPPEVGSAMALLPGVHWVRLPVPGALKHINVWLLEDGDGWTLVDTGMDVPAGRAAWDGALHDYLGGRPLRRILCTHHHPDHAGLAAWLAARHGVAVYMSAAEAGLLTRFANLHADPRGQAARLAGFARDGLVATEATRVFLSGENYGRVVSGLPPDLREIKDGEVISVGRHRLRTHLVRGHTDGQLVFHEPQAGFLIAGDQVLPRITSNIGIYPERADGDPVASFLASFERLDLLEPEPIVLPSHGNVFRGLRLRLAALRAHHEVTLDRVRGLVEAPTTARELAERLFRSPLDSLNLMLAVGESLANLEHLARRGELEAADGPDGHRRYRPSRRA